MFKWFKTPTAMALAEVELAEARRMLLQAETQAEYFHHRVAFLRSNIARLNGYLSKGD
jgi:hypothetical protein